MDSLSTQKVKPRKMKTLVKKSKVQTLLDLFYRVIEITVVMVTVAKLCYQLVIMFEDSGLTRFLINRHLAFLLGNAIVISIVAKCGLFQNQEPDAPRRKSKDFYDDFVRESSRREQSLHREVACREKQSNEEKSRAKQIGEDKKQSRAKQNMVENRAKQSTEDNREKQSNEEKSRAKQISEDKKQSLLGNRAKQSTEDNREKQSTDITVKRQRQIVTQAQESPRKSCERSGSERHSAADVSDDELRYKIESFIARQRRNQKDEQFCIA